MAQNSLEGRDNIADDIFGRVMQQHHHAPAGRKVGVYRDGKGLNEQRMLGHRKNIRSFGLAVPARDAGKAMGYIGNFNVERGGVEQVEPTTRQHPLPSARGSFARH